ncbi:MAG: alpha/beta hydrolase [Acidobacteria bacterium]|nr:alpha/beta hydrolase [Acidobacteriota bacterium]
MSKGTPNADDPREQPERSIVAAVATLDPCGTIEVNGDRLKTEIDKMRSRLKVDKINILAHSKGGLEARYADSKGYEKYISQIIQLGTPNGGSFLADYRPPGWRWGCPAEITDQLTTESMAAFNVAYPAGSSVDYTVLAGDIDGGIFDIFKDDRVVSVASVFSIEAESLTKLLYRGFDAGHSDLYQSNSVFDCISPAVLSLSWPQPSFPCLAPEERATRAGNPAVATLTPRIGTIFGGETKTESFTIDMASNVTFQLIYRSDQQNPGVEPANNLNLTLISPNGIRIPVPDDEEDGLGARSLRQNFATLQTGIWNVEVTAATVVGTPPVPYGIFISGNSPVIDFDGSFESSSICSGETLQLRGRTTRRNV